MSDDENLPAQCHPIIKKKNKTKVKSDEVF